METILLSAGMLSRFIVLQANPFSTAVSGCACVQNSQVRLESESLFSTRVKIEVERATSNPDRYVHLRFCNTNRYWQVRATLIEAVSNKPEEDTTKPSSTLFEAVRANNDGVFNLIHVQSRLRVFVDTQYRFAVGTALIDQQSRFTSVNWDTLVKLPRNVALKGDNDQYLRGIVLERQNYLQFSATDPNASASIHEVHLMNDGHVRIKSRHYDRFWRRSPNWIWGDSTDTTANNRDTLFWPVKIDETTIALRNAGNNQFCKRLTAEGKVSCLNAAESTITTEAILVLQELVRGRRIYNVRYWVENARIFNESPFLAGTTTVFNYSDSEAGIAVEVSYEESQSRSFSRSVSLTAGVTTTIEAGVPLITSASVSVSYQINTTLEWNDTTTTTRTVRATGSVPVPPRSVATVSYVGTTGSCDVPFSYTQQDTSSTDGRITETEEIDGVFRGVNSYNFSFVVERTQPL